MVFHRILDFKTRLGFYPGLFFFVMPNTDCRLLTVNCLLATPLKRFTFAPQLNNNGRYTDH